MNLYEMSDQARTLYQLLEEDEIDENIYFDTLESIGANEKLESYIYVQKQFEANLQSFKKEKERIEKRMKTCQNNIERMKSAIMEFMTSARLKKVQAGTFTLSLRSYESVNITDENQIPEEFLIPQPPKINKAEIKKYLKSGDVISGAEIIQKDSVTAR